MGLLNHFDPGDNQSAWTEFAKNDEFAKVSNYISIATQHFTDSGSSWGVALCQNMKAVKDFQPFNKYVFKEVLKTFDIAS
jgi:hypothetical protein